MLEETARRKPYDLQPVSNIIWVIKSRRMRWARHVAGLREGRGAYRVLVGKRENLKDVGIGGMVILCWMLMEYDERACVV
jgi:hypothetical protein